MSVSISERLSALTVVFGFLFFDLTLVNFSSSSFSTLIFVGDFVAEEFALASARRLSFFFLFTPILGVTLTESLGSEL